METEVWKGVVGYEGHYQISSLGNIKSLKRKIQYTHHITNEIQYMELQGKPLKPCLDSSGYYLCVLRKSGIGASKRVHVLVAESFLGHKSNGNRGIVVDHIDNNKLNNRVENLQVISNRQNTSKNKKLGTSKYTGVHWCKTNKKWCAMIRLNGMRKNLGLFESEFDAHIAYQNNLP